MKITHHPDDATLMSYAAGSLPEALSAVVCTHVSMCPACAREVRTLERIGCAMLERLEPAAVVSGAPLVALRAMEADDVGAAKTVPDPAADVPMPLRRLVGPRIDEIRWRRLGMGVWHLPLPLSRSGEGDLRLLRVAPGQGMPEHGHGGAELTLILRGSYRDRIGDYRVGDVADLDDEVEHKPIADSETGCICIIASERRARFKGLFGRIVQPLTGI
jgi:putative transcriptional regulator